jgi:hypothetical protein
MRYARAIGAVVSALVAVSAGCGNSVHYCRCYSERDSTPGPRYALLGDRSSLLAIDLPVARAAATPPHYVLHEERSGVTSELRAVAFARGQVWVAGDDGVVLRRSRTNDWQRETIPTRARIRAIAAVGSTVLAVGDGGLALARSADGAWSLEATQSTADLYAITAAGGHTFAVGDRGTMLERTDGAWYAIATDSVADLRDFKANVAVGLGGAIIDCAYWDRDDHHDPHLLVCVPRPSPIKADLLASVSQPWRAYGAGGTQLASAPRRPTDAYVMAVLAGGRTITGAADNDYSATERLPTILVGRAGVVALVDRRSGLTAVGALPDATDLDAVASDALDSFAVGANGTIVHLQTESVEIEEASRL